MVSTSTFFYLQLIQFNAHEVSEFVLTAPKTLDNSKNESLGAAIYPTLALFNHSCHSAQVRSVTLSYNIILNPTFTL